VICRTNAGLELVVGDLTMVVPARAEPRRAFLDRIACRSASSRVGEWPLCA